MPRSAFPGQADIANMNPPTFDPLAHSPLHGDDPANKATDAFEAILAALQSHATIQPDAIAYTFLKSDEDRQTLMYEQLDLRARSIAHALLQHAQPGDRALMAYPPGLEFIEAFLGCLYAGIVAVPAYPPKKNRNADRVLAIAHDCQPRLLLCSTETRSSLNGAFVAALAEAKVLSTDERDGAHGRALPSADSSDLAFLQYTSGSTASPKGVMITQGNMAANERLIQQYFGFSGTSVVVSWLPMFHDMGPRPSRILGQFGKMGSCAAGAL